MYASATGVRMRKRVRMWMRIGIWVPVWVRVRDRIVWGQKCVSDLHNLGLCAKASALQERGSDRAGPGRAGGARGASCVASASANVSSRCDPLMRDQLTLQNSEAQNWSTSITRERVPQSVCECVWVCTDDWVHRIAIKYMRKYIHKYQREEERQKGEEEEEEAQWAKWG